jgi:D-beta-D-heptose 7-phosphate kinase/D-beta-D-heptose 1-phosphate adenosyltransferase
LKGEIKRIVEALGSPEILVVGDVIADVYVWAASAGMSLEAPVLMLEEESREVRAAGAALVAENLVGLGAKVRVAGVIGEDAAGEKLLNRLSSMGVNTEAVLLAADRVTPTRRRYMASLSANMRAVQQVLSVIKRNPNLPRASIMEELMGRVEDHLSEVELVVCVDYGLCRPTRTLAPEVIQLARSRGTKVVLEPKGTPGISELSGADIVVLNREQGEVVAGVRIELEEDMRVAGERIAEKLSAKAVVITVGRDGIFLYEGPNKCKLFRTQVVQVSDLIGAEEAGLSAMSAVIASGGTYADAVTLANFAAGVAIREVGGSKVGKEEILARLSNGRTEGKVLSEEEFVRKAEEWHRCGKKVVFTNGCFDIVHVGHVKYLEYAKSQGDCLMIGVNSDESVRKLKGEGRPVNQARDRTMVLAGLESVDCATIFGEDTPIKLIEAVKPDVLVKGEDWEEMGVVGQEFVESYGGRVLLAPVEKGVSTTRIIRKMGEEGDNGG